MDIEALLLTVATRVVKLLKCRGRHDDDDDGPVDALGALRAESIASRLPSPPDDADPPRRGRRSAFLEGFSLHPNTHLREHDRGLERLCVHGARGPLSLQRLTELPDGRLSYFMKRTGPNGRTHLVLTPAELLRKLSALVPRPRVHLTRYHGVFAPNAAARSRVVPAPPPAPAPQPAELQNLPPPLVPPAPVLPASQRVPWADLLERTLGLDVLACPGCDGKAARPRLPHRPRGHAGILDLLGLPSSPPRLAPARERPQLDLVG